MKLKDNVVTWVNKGRAKEGQGGQEILWQYDNAGLKSGRITGRDIVKLKCMAR